MKGIHLLFLSLFSCLCSPTINTGFHLDTHVVSSMSAVVVSSSYLQKGKEDEL